MDDFIIRKNLELFKRKLLEARTEPERKTIERLLTEESMKATFANASNVDLSKLKG